MESEIESDEMITIQFFIDSSKYHYGNLKNKLSEGNRPEIDKEGVKEVLGKSKGLMIEIPVTFYFNEGYATELYEFYSFVNSVMASVNNIIDFKSRMMDGYSQDRSISFGNYMGGSPKYKKFTAHKLIIENSEWIEEVRVIRNIIQHKPIQNFIIAHLVFNGEIDKKGNITDKSYVRKYVPMKTGRIEILQFCDDTIRNLEDFWKYMKKELGN